MSAIDPTKPTAGVAYTADVRANFATAKAEIEAFSASNGSALVGFLQSGTGAVAGTVQDQLRKMVFRSNYDTIGHYNTAKAASSARLFLDPHQDTNYITGDGSADGALNIYSQIISSHDIVLAAAGTADIHVGNVAGGTGVFSIDMDIIVTEWLNGTRGHGLRILSSGNTPVIEFPTTAGTIELYGNIRGGNGANKDLLFFNGGASGQLKFINSANSGFLLTFDETATLSLAATAGTNPKIQPTNRNLVLGIGTALATTDTNGHIMIPSCAGTPTGVPTGQGAGHIPMIFDTSGVKLWFYTGGSWKGVTVA